MVIESKQAIRRRHPANSDAATKPSVVELTPDQKADGIINTMIGGIIAGAIVPTPIYWTITATALGSGVVGIGMVYGVSLTKDEAWKLVKQFVTAAGFTFCGLALSTKIISLVLASTGVGYFGAMALDATFSAALAYAVGESAKAYFKGNRDQKLLGEIMRSRFAGKRSELQSQSVAK